MQKNGREALQNFTAPNKRVQKDPTHKKIKKMIAYVPVVLKEIFEQGREYAWERPATCPKCNHYKVWSHGFVQRFFDGFDTFLLLKCYRCPNCGCVITLRPDSHFSRIQASKETIRFSLCHRLKIGRWPPGLSLSRQRHWLKNLRRRIKALLTEVWTRGEIAAFDYFVSIGQTPVSSSI